MIQPAPEATACSTPIPLTWIRLGSPQRGFGFSGDKLNFMEARDACRAQPGKVRLAVLDTLFTEVASWVKNNHPDRGYWVDATRPIDTSEVSRYYCILYLRMTIITPLRFCPGEIWVISARKPDFPLSPCAAYVWFITLIGCAHHCVVCKISYVSVSECVSLMCVCLCVCGGWGTCLFVCLCIYVRACVRVCVDFQHSWHQLLLVYPLLYFFFCRLSVFFHLKKTNRP